MGTSWELDGNTLGKITKKKQKKSWPYLLVDEEVLQSSSSCG
jgi:hypothetical protein